MASESPIHGGVFEFPCSPAYAGAYVPDDSVVLTSAVDVMEVGAATIMGGFNRLNIRERRYLR